MDTRSRSERLDGSSCFFLDVISYIEPREDGNNTSRGLLSRELSDQ